MLYPFVDFSLIILQLPVAFPLPIPAVPGRGSFPRLEYQQHALGTLKSVVNPDSVGSGITGIYFSVAGPVEPKLFGDLEPEPKISLNKHFQQSVWRMLRRRKANFYLY